MIFKNMTAAQAARSKTIIGGMVLFIAGGYLMYKGEYPMAMAAIGNGLAVIGIRDHTAGG